MVINHLEKLFVTNDAATILRELEVKKTLEKKIIRKHAKDERLQMKVTL